MADHVVSLNYPNPINWARWYRNGMVPAGHGYRWVALLMANAAQLRKKLVFSHMQDFSAIETAAGPGNTTRWRFRFRSGYASTRLEFAMLLGLEDHASSSDPYCYWTTVEVGGGSGPGPEFRYGQFSGSPDDTPDEFMWTSQSIDITPASEYECHLEVNDYCRPIGCLVFERGALTGLDDTLTGAVDPTKYALGQPILDEDVVELAEAGTNVWKRNGSQLISWSGENTAGGGEFTSTATSYTNPFDSTTTVASTSVGHTVQTTYHNTDTETTVPIEFAAYVAKVDPGGEKTGGDGAWVLLTDGTNTVELDCGTGTAEGWFSVAGTIPAGLAKWDVHLKVQAMTSVELYAFHLCEYEA